MNRNLYIVRYNHFSGDIEEQEYSNINDAETVFNSIYNGRFADDDKDLYESVELLSYSFDTHSETSISAKNYLGSDENEQDYDEYFDYYWDLNNIL